MKHVSPANNSASRANFELGSSGVADSDQKRSLRAAWRLKVGEMSGSPHSAIGIQTPSAAAAFNSTRSR